MFAFALAVALILPLLLAGSWQEWIYRTFELLVVACPCAMVISTPVTIVSGLAAAARKGILIKGGVYLETGRSLNLLALDKTGTITHGKPVQTDYLPLSERGSQTRRQLAASLAARSDHPVSKALARHAQENGVAIGDGRHVRSSARAGVKGEMASQFFYLGNHRLVEYLGICSSELETVLMGLEKQGKTGRRTVQQRIGPSPSCGSRNRQRVESRRNPATS